MSELKKAKPENTLGRKRDHTLDTRILEAAIEILAELGFDGMTMDMVAARTKSGKATLYRRWPSKAELVRDALIWMSQSSVELEHLPDTGNLRDDLLALVKPYSLEFSERKLRVLAKLGSFFSEHRKIAEEASAGIFGPWTDFNRTLMQRAIKRGEIPAQADIEMACQVIIAMTSYRSITQGQPFGRTDYAALLDHILLPGLKHQQ
ncbi:MAG: TetR/AcrR family transcriptional regulator [Candidatus Sericytochromatia bacterium]|nr:TetR/AcrR family transcriptional regulator [Candidatus Sericytochromatia bacterium]